MNQDISLVQLRWNLPSGMPRYHYQEMESELENVMKGIFGHIVQVAVMINQLAMINVVTVNLDLWLEL